MPPAWAVRAESPDVGIEGPRLDQARAGRGLAPSIIAVKVFLGKPSASPGRLESTYIIRGLTRTVWQWHAWPAAYRGPGSPADAGQAVLATTRSAGAPG